MPITSEQQNEILDVCNGFFNGAPGQAFLNEFIAAIEGGATIKQLADAFEASSAFNDIILGGQTTTAAKVAKLMENYGLTPGNSDPASGDAIAEAFFTAQLDAGVSYADVVLQAVAYLEGTVPDEFIATQILYMNKAAVAAAYSATKTSVDINELLSVYSGLTGTALLTQEEIDEIVANALPITEPIFTLTSGVAAIEAAEAALDAFLLEAGQDPDVPGEEPALTEGDIATALDDAVAAVDVQVVNDGSYIAASKAVRAAMISDTEEALAGALTTAEDNLTDAMAAVAEVDGLSDAVTALATADEADAAAQLNVSLAFNDYAGAELSYNAGAADDADEALVGGAGTPVDSIGDINGPLVETNADGDLELAAGITETTNPGITALMEAAAAYNASIVAAEEAFDAAVAAQAIVENLEAAAAGLAELAALGAEFTSTTPADVDAPTVAEIEAEQANLAALLQTADAAAAANGDTDIDNALGLLSVALDGAADSDAVAVVTAQAVSDGYITSADKALIDAAAAAEALDADAGPAADAALTDNNPQQRNDDFTAAFDDYDLAVGATPLTDAKNAAEAAVEEAQGDIDALAEAVAAQTAAQGDVDALAALNTAITDAIDAFDTNGFETPVALDGATAASTSADDIFYLGDSDSTDIFSFGLLGNDSLIIGTGFTLNEDTVAGDNGDNNALEVWITEDSGDTLVTLETTTFGSNAGTPEVAEITLVGVDVADVMLADGIITVA
jgi:hypothetical protein